MQVVIKQCVEKAVEEVFPEVSEMPGFDVLVPPRAELGDYSANIAMILAKTLKRNPMEIAEAIAGELEKEEIFERVEAAPPGYVNMTLSGKVFEEMLAKIIEKGALYGGNEKFSGKNILVEYTDPNPFKVFHIGHLMTNVIGESIARLYEASGADVKRCVYQGDVGMHVAKSLWGAWKIKDELPEQSASGEVFAEFFGKAYVLGSSAYEEDPSAQKEMQEINAKVYDRSDEQINELYDLGREKTLEHFEKIYQILGTKFDYYFFESKTAVRGMELVERGLQEGIFEESDGAIVYAKEGDGLHTRVFRNAKGLPTYEAKDLGLIEEKRQVAGENVNLSLVITANEQSAYFRVVLAAARELLGKAAENTRHIGHGMMRLATGKMGSRKGNVISGESLLLDTIDRAKTKVGSKDIDDVLREEIARKVGVGAIKYAILKQSIGKDIVFNPEESLSLEGNSGPYVQYALIRAKSVLKKAEDISRAGGVDRKDNEGRGVEALLLRYPDVVEEACTKQFPHLVGEFVFSLAQEFNAFYAKHSIAQGSESAPYRLAMTQSVAVVLEHALSLLGISAPEKM